MISDRRSYIYRCLDALSQLLNTWLFCGDPDESISGRCYRERRWSLVSVINGIFFWQDHHCRLAYNEDLIRAKARVMRAE